MTWEGERVFFALVAAVRIRDRIFFDRFPTKN